MLDLKVNNENIELSEQTSFRLNKTFFDVTRITFTESDYSFSINLPATDKNNKVFGYASVAEIPNKFSKKFEAVLYADEIKMFEGELILSSYSEGEYSGNLVVQKVKTIEEIFGSDTLDNLKWTIPYSGADTINEINSDENGKVYFPFVSYGVFIKKPYYSDAVRNDYTDTHIIDSTNRFYHSTFQPSLNLNETVKRLFNQKGYEVQGDVFDDSLINNIYISESIEDGQIPLYNYGNKLLGEIDIESVYASSKNDAITSELSFKYYPTDGSNSYLTDYNFKNVDTFNILEGTNTSNHLSYLFDNEDNVIVIPADGFYKIELGVNAKVNGIGQQVTIKQKRFVNNSEPAVDESCTVTTDITEWCPVEIQLHKRGDVELIKGKNNKSYVGGLPVKIGSYRYGVSEWVNCYPHEAYNGLENPTSVDPTIKTGQIPQRRQNTGGFRRNSKAPEQTYVSSIRQGNIYYRDNTVMAYDRWVNPDFIMGFSTYLGSTMSVIKNGKSHYRGDDGKSMSFYNQAGYIYNDNGTEQQSTYNQNTYDSAPESWCSIIGSDTLKGKLYAVVYLNRNDVLELTLVQRHYDDFDYTSNVTTDLKITALSPVSNEAEYKRKGFNYFSESEFDKDLNLGNFMSSGQTMAEFVEDYLNSFNLQFQQSGKIVNISTKTRESNNYIDIDDRIHRSELKFNRIEFPRSMEVQFNVDTNEWGYWLTVPSQYRNETDWEAYGDKGSKPFSYNTDNESSTLSLKHSPTFYDTFISGSTALRMPVIAKYEDMAEGADYEDAMNSDGYSLPMRFWLRNKDLKGVLSLTNGESVNIYIPGGDLNYKSEESLLKYFNFWPASTANETEADVYLTPYEYSVLRGGGKVKLNETVYSVESITGFDPEEKNKTTLKLIN